MLVKYYFLKKTWPYSKTSSLKHFIGYNDSDVIIPLCINLPQTIGFVKSCDNNNTMPFKVTDKEKLGENLKTLSH